MTADEMHDAKTDLLLSLIDDLHEEHAALVAEIDDEEDAILNSAPDLADAISTLWDEYSADKVNSLIAGLASPVFSDQIGRADALGKMVSKALRRAAAKRVAARRIGEGLSRE